MSDDLFKVADPEAMEAEVERQKKLAEERAANAVASLKGFPFFLKGTNVETRIILLAPAPVTFNAHNITLEGNGKQRYEFLICKAETESGCMACTDNVSGASWKGALPIMDLTPWTDKNGVTHATGGIKLLIRNFGDIQALLREVQDMPVGVKRDITGVEKHVPMVHNSIVRINKDGIGKNVKYSFRYMQREAVSKEIAEKIAQFYEKYPDANTFTKEWLSAYMERIEADYKKNGSVPRDDAYTNYETAPTPTANLGGYASKASDAEYTSDDDIPF